MVFSSFIFLWIFLPIIIVGYYLVGDKFKNIFLVLGSLIFYAWGEPTYFAILLVCIIANWVIGLLMSKYESSKQILLIIAIVLDLGNLVVFKYLDFFINIVNSVFDCRITVEKSSLPLGISFFTFQILSYMIDLYRGYYPAQKSLINMALYVSFFPKLIQGPIVRYKDIFEQIQNRECTSAKMAEGIRRFIYGLGKKVILANTLGACVDQIWELDYMQLSGMLAWSAAIIYTLQIYYDFSGYSDMAIGLGKIFGFDFLENFQYPYKADSIQNFWQRWHISLGTWFKEYLYIPLGGNRKGKLRTCINLIIVFATTGLWHGTDLQYVIWGLYHGIFSILERTGWKVFLKSHKWFAHIYTMFIVITGWVFFRSQSLLEACVFLKRMLLPWKYMESTVFYPVIFGNKTLLIILLGIVGCGGCQKILQRMKIKRWKGSIGEILYCAVIMFICLAELASNTYNPFIYFRF